MIFALATLSAVYAATFDVKVGVGGNTFSPNLLDVAVGDEINFIFAAGDAHNVIQSDSKGACTASALATRFRFPPTGLADLNAAFKYVVPAGQSKIWFYCGPHCAGGMVGQFNVGGGATPSVAVTSVAGAIPTAKSSGVGKVASLSAIALAASFL